MRNSMVAALAIALGGLSAIAAAILNTTIGKTVIFYISPALKNRRRYWC